ncbi:hypothetical protein AA0118_g7614 [Alternaria tenuissima]|nr:hypothetical protein AA0118_g7614 [Alternaria tenuissima]
MDHTNIIDTDEAACTIAAASQGKSKGKGRKKATETRASGPIKPTKTTMEPTKARSKTLASPTSPTTPTLTQASASRFYEANGLKIPLYSQNGLGNKKRPNARLSKTLLKYNTDELLDIVGQYAGTDKRQELKNKGLAKTMLANWIEEKETLALGRNPKSELSYDQEKVEQSDDVASFLAPTTTTSSSPNTKKHTATTPAFNSQGDSPPTSTKGDDTFVQPRQRKRSAPGRSRDDQPPAKLQKRDITTNLSTEDIENLGKKRSIDKPFDDVIPTPSQTNAQTAAYNDRDHDIYPQNAFFNSAGMNPSDPDRSSMIVRGDGEDRVLTATSHETFRGPVTYLFETTIPHNAPSPPSAISPPPIPYLKNGLHGRNGDFQDDPDRRTGVGHLIEPEDQLKWDEYKNFRGTLYQQFPQYPATVTDEMKKASLLWYSSNTTPRYDEYSTYLAYIPSQNDLSPNLITSSLQTAIIKFSSKYTKQITQNKLYDIRKATAMSTSLKRTSEEAGAEPISMRSNKKPCLSLEVPGKEISKEEDKTPKTRAATAERREPKLKRPFPKKREEIKDPNKMKLTRHYTTNDPTPLSKLPIIRPPIARSARVDKLLESLSVPDPTKNADDTKRIRLATQTRRGERQNEMLKQNKSITESDYAIRLAWSCFSSNEKNRVGRERMGMMISGLEWDDLANERKGVPNNLPEWRKTNTGRFAKSDLPCE